MSDQAEPKEKQGSSLSKMQLHCMRILRPFTTKKFWRRFAISLVAFIVFATGGMYGIALWYQHTQAGKPYELGATFIPSYASYLGVDPHETLDAMINDLGIRQFRFTSYWNEIEPQQGTYDFSTLDWQMAAAEKAGAQVSLAIGLRQPRWPECHAPSWVDTTKPTNEWQPELEAFIAKVVERYKDSSALASYQLENEFFNSFGDCHNFDPSLSLTWSSSSTQATQLL